MCICASIYLFVHLLYMYYMCNFGQRSVCLKTLVLPRGSSAQGSLRKKYLFSDTKVWCCIPQRQFTHKITFLRGSSVLKDLVLHFPEEVYSHNNFSHMLFPKSSDVAQPRQLTVILCDMIRAMFIALKTPVKCFVSQKKFSLACYITFRAYESTSHATFSPPARVG